MKSFHFDVGNSTEGPIGFCARVTAVDKTAALEVLKMQISLEINDRINHSDIEYICVYINPDALTINDIYEVEDPTDGG